MLKTFLVLIIIYLLSRIFFRYIFPVIIRNFVNKAAQGMQGQFGEQQQQFQQYNRRPEGEVIIEKPAAKNSGKSRPHSSGDDDFVDYTEVK